MPSQQEFVQMTSENNGDYLNGHGNTQGWDVPPIICTLSYSVKIITQCCNACKFLIFIDAVPHLIQKQVRKFPIRDEEKEGMRAQKGELKEGRER